MDDSLKKDMYSNIENPLGYKPIGPLLAKFAIPGIISMVANALYNVVDQIFIGNGVGYLGNAATTVAFPINTITLAYCLLIGVGGASLAAIRLGEGKKESAELILGNALSLVIIISVALLAVSFVFFEPMLKIFGATDSIMPYAKEYTGIILLGLPFMALGGALNNFIRVDGSPTLSMTSLLAGAVLNTILDPIFIFVFHWGVSGAAIATVISQIVSTGIVMLYFIYMSNLKIRPSNLKPDRKLTAIIISLGFSSCITQLANTILQVIMNNSLIFYGNQSNVGGDVALSAMGIVLKINWILISVLIGLSIGAQPILGFNKGAGNYERILKTFKYTAICSTVISVIGCIFVTQFPQYILLVFGSGSAVFSEFAEKCMSVFLAGVFCAGFQIVASNYFQATGQPLKAILLSMTRQIFLLIPFIIILPKIYGLDGILFAGPYADLGAVAITSIFIFREMRYIKDKVKSQSKLAT